MICTEWKQAALATMRGLIVSMGYPMLQYVEVAYTLVQERQAAAAGYAG